MIGIIVAGAGILLGIPVSFAAGVWLRSLGVRVLATLSHPVRGIQALPANWRRILWAMGESLSQAAKILKSSSWFLEHLKEHASNLAYLWRFNLNGFDLAPWQWLNIAGAVLTFALFYYSDRVHRAWTLAKEPDPAATPEDTHIGRLLLMTRLRNLCVFLYLPLAFAYAFLELGAIDVAALTGWLAPLGTLFGPYLGHRRQLNQA